MGEGPDILVRGPFIVNIEERKLLKNKSFRTNKVKQG